MVQIPYNTDTSPDIFSEPARINKRTRRDAHCLSCNFSWKPRNGTSIEPPRCPYCFSRKTIWEDENESPLVIPKAENKQDIIIPVRPAETVAATPEPATTSVEEPDDNDFEEVQETNITQVKPQPENSRTSFGIGGIVILLALGVGGYFFIKTIIKNQKPKKIQEGIPQAKQEVEEKKAIAKPILRPGISAIIV